MREASRVDGPFSEESKIGNRKSKMSSYDPVRPRQHIWRNRQADLLRSLQVHDELEFCRLLHWKIGGLDAF